ncbi:helix-turn-helix transcriptional regulator [Litoribacillus peritrichatus]|uniref:HTH luxR-type domain-containing protein n=1 Tax=Litoribacillus peritrichatus TaxID=718191 RepID=A0ABP7MKV4_9GAMM
MSQITTQIIQQIYDTIDNPDHWQEVLNEISKTTRSNHTFMVTRSSVDDEPLGFFEEGFEEGHFDLYRAHYYQVDVWTKNLANHPFNQFHPSHKVFDDRQFLNTEIYNDFAKPADIRHSIGCLLSPAGSDFITELAFMRGKSQQQYDQQSIDTVNAYLPHIEHSMSLAQKLYAQNVKSKNLFSAFDHLPEAVIVCKEAFKIEFFNQAASDIFCGSNLFRVSSNNTLSFQSTDTQARFIKASNDSLHSLSGTGKGIHYLYLNDQNTAYRLTIKPWLHKRISPCGELTSPGLILTLQTCATSRTVHPQEITLHFPLTSAEAHICAQLCNGLSAEQIAHYRNAQLSTVRQQIKSCLAKTDSSSQLEMINKILRAILVY